MAVDFGDFIPYGDIPFDASSIQQEKLDVGLGRRMNGLPWRGQFTPDLVDTLLHAYGRPGLLVDPFCGSGTALAEACRTGMPSHGVEVNPAAYVLARLHTLAEFSVRQRQQSLTRTYKAMVDAHQSDVEVIAKLVRSFDSSVDRTVGQAAFLLTLGNGDVFRLADLKRAFTRITNLVEGLPAIGAPLTVTLGDARDIKLATGSASMVLTSPPYVNVFNYHQNYRPGAELLGWEILPAARAEFGSNRKHRQNRFLTVIQYAQDSGLALLEMARVVEPGGRSVWVVGRESKVLSESIKNPEIIYAMATQGCGMNLSAKHQRCFTSRFGEVVYEDILVFDHPENCEQLNTLAEISSLGRRIGTGVLQAIVDERPGVRQEVSAAIDAMNRVEPSPVPDFNNATG